METKKLGYREEFIYSSDTECPLCGSTDIVAVGSILAMADGEDIDQMHCKHCKCEWDERSDGFVTVTKPSKN